MAIIAFPSAGVFVQERRFRLPDGIDALTSDSAEEMKNWMPSQVMQAPKGEMVPKHTVRDQGPYSSRNTSKGSIIAAASLVFGVLSEGLSIGDVRDLTLKGNLLRQPSRNTRERIWDALHHRYLTHRIGWIIDSLAQASRRGTQSQEFISLLYLHYVLRDHLTYDFVTETLWNKWLHNSHRVSQQDVLELLDRASSIQVQIKRWTETSRAKLAGSILAALRDFGLLEGAAKKKLVKPDLPLSTAEHMVRLLTAEGLRGRQILEDPIWMIFLCNESDVNSILAKLALEHRIRFEKAGNTVVLETPGEWEEP